MKRKKKIVSKRRKKKKVEVEKISLKKKIKFYSEKLKLLKKEIHKAIVGQDEVVDSVLKALISNGHVLLEGVPGIAKTFLVRVLARAVKGATFSRIQFTPDLLPSDITGITIYEKGKGFYVKKGPVFANFVLGDEINRAPPKVQSAMLQVMQEREVTIGNETFKLPKPFLVLATQNPLEQKGVYPLPEAQVDRFLFKVLVFYPTKEEEKIIIDQNIDVKSMEEFGIKKVISLNDILEMQSIVKKIFISEEVKDYITSLVEATRYPKKYDLELGKYIRWGASPRASIFLALGGRATAFMDGRDFVIPDDVKSVAKDVLRHRIILTYEGRAKEISTDQIVEEILERVPVK